MEGYGGSLSASTPQSKPEPAIEGHSPRVRNWRHSFAPVVLPMNLYEVLEVSKDVDDETLRRAIAHQSAIWSKRIPMAISVQKRHEAENMLHRLAEAKHLLLDPERRQAYNSSLEAVTEAAVPMELRQASAATPQGPRRRMSDATPFADRQPCPYCGEQVLLSAKKCRWCNEWLEGGAVVPTLSEAARDAGNGNALAPPTSQTQARPLLVPPTKAAPAANSAGKHIGALVVGLGVVASSVYFVTRDTSTTHVSVQQPTESISADRLHPERPAAEPSVAGTTTASPRREVSAQPEPTPAKAKTLNAMVTETAKDFLGRPTVTSPLDQGKDGTQEALVTGTAGFDCVTFVESAVARARSKALGDSSEAGYGKQLERLRYRHGVRDGYASRLHYFSEWVADNAARGNVKDITAELGGSPDVRQLDFMTAHRSLYPKLVNEAVFSQLRSAEAVASSKERFVLPKAEVARVLGRLESGDILAVTTDIPGLDVVHTGIIIRQPDGSVHLMHALPGGAVTVSRLSLVNYLKVYKEQRGVIVARPLAPTPAPQDSE
jgi:hypothetical protein